MNPIILIGSAPCLDDDLARIRDRDRFDVMVIGLSSIKKYSGPVRYVANNHPENNAAIRGILAERGIGGCEIIEPYESPVADIVFWYDGPTGSSAITGALWAIQAGYRKIILAGCPLSGETSMGEDCSFYHPGWEAKKDQLIGLVKSMSGWTRELLGEPTAAWMERGSRAEAGKTGIKADTRWDYIIALAKRQGWARGVELGIWYGETFFHLLDALPSLYLTGVDIWETEVVRDGVVIYREKDYRDKPTHHLDRQENRREVYRRQAGYAKRSTILDMFTVDAAKLFADESVDFVFIDASHDYPSIVDDITAWAPKLKRGGFLVGHDFEWPTVAAAVIDTLDNYYADPVGPNGEVLWAWRKP